MSPFQTLEWLDASTSRTTNYIIYLCVMQSTHLCLNDIIILIDVFLFLDFISCSLMCFFVDFLVVI